MQNSIKKPQPSSLAAYELSLLGAAIVFTMSSILLVVVFVMYEAKLVLELL